ncbi:MAG: phosphoglycolate phosphatase [Gammaproteobacteria bacterium]|nr:phosphoglycolate phosphatase [Gammaproteobacteria bacterium]MDE2345342.1 phosphoglycolate phosphatase [Gammaproteobacteria bacterium]
MTSIRLVAFDLDGTLVDSAADIACAVACMSEELGLRPPDVTEVRTWVGDGLRMLLKRALGNGHDCEPPDQLYQQALSAFRRAYLANLTGQSRLYAGTLECLDRLRAQHLRLACVTNKSAEFSLPLLEALEIRQYFGLVLSGDTLAQRKPHPLPLLHAASHFGIAPDAACMVGDSRNDLLAARAAGYAAVGVRYGYGGELDGYGPDALLDSLAQLPPLLEQWTRPMARGASA